MGDFNTVVSSSSHYSAVHDSFSRIDYALVSSSLYSVIWNSLLLGGVPQKCIARTWKFPSYLYESEDFRSFLKTNWQVFLDDHISQLEDNTLIWLTSKAAIRGHISSYLVMRIRGAEGSVGGTVH